MAIDRSGTINEATSPAPSGTAFLTQYGSFMDALIDTAVLRLATVAGTNAITAVAEPFQIPATGLVSGMKFTLVPVANNTAAATLNIDARGAQSIVNGDGSSLAADALVSGTRYFLEFDGTNFVIIGAFGGAAAAVASRTTYDTTTVWANSLPTNTLVLVELWGAGGGGNSSLSDGGGGGAYARKLFKAGDLPTSVTITIPSGGAAGASGVAGGNATFGSLLTAYGGGGASGASAPGAGGGELGAGTTVPGAVGGGLADSDAATIFGGGGGGNGGVAGGKAVYGGGGGGGSGQAGGLSAYGGNGGASGAAGARPGGGGGYQAAGGGGRCIVTVYGG